MADGVNLPPAGTGDTGVKASTQKVTADSSDVQDVALASVVAGVRTRVSAAAPLPVVQTGTPGLPTGAATESTQTAQSTLYGAVTESAPGTDTASSGLNGRLQRIAQNITTFIGRLPASLGQKTMANSLAVTVASDQTAVPVSGTVTASGPLTDAQLRATPVPVSGTVTANAGSGTQAVSLATLPALVAGSANIGDVDVLTLPALPAGSNNIGDVDVLTLPSLPAGANAIGKLAANSGVDIGDVDVLSLPANASVNAAQIAGTAAAVNSGNASAGTLRVVLATDQPQLNNALFVSLLAPVQAATATLTNVSASASSVTLLNSAGRKGLVIVNDSTSILYVKFGSAASATSFTYFLAGSVGGVPATLELPYVTYTGIVTGIWASAVGAARCTELT